MERHLITICKWFFILSSAQKQYKYNLQYPKLCEVLLNAHRSPLWSYNFKAVCVTLVVSGQCPRVPSSCHFTKGTRFISVSSCRALFPEGFEMKRAGKHYSTGLKDDKKNIHRQRSTSVRMEEERSALSLRESDACCCGFDKSPLHI